MPGSAAQFRRELTDAHGRADKFPLGQLSQVQLSQIRLAIRDGSSQAELLILILHEWNRVDELAVMKLLGVPANRFNDLLRSLQHRIGRVADRQRHDHQLARNDSDDRQHTRRYRCPECGQTSALGPRDGRFCGHCGGPLEGVSPRPASTGRNR